MIAYVNAKYLFIPYFLVQLYQTFNRLITVSFFVLDVEFWRSKLLRELRRINAISADSIDLYAM